MAGLITKKMVTKITIFVTIVFAVFLYALPVMAATTSPSPSATATAVCEGIGLTGGECATGGASGNKLNNIVANIINIFSWVVGAVSVIMLIFGGFKYVTSGGDANKVKSAKDTILYALIGVAVVALSQVIVRFVLGAANSVI